MYGHGHFQSSVWFSSLVHNHDSGDRKTQCKVLRAHIKRKAADMSVRPSNIIYSEMNEHSMENLQPADLKSKSTLSGEMEKYQKLP